MQVWTGLGTGGVGGMFNVDNFTWVGFLAVQYGVLAFLNNPVVYYHTTRTR